jgi:acyl carrier protein
MTTDAMGNLLAMPGPERRAELEAMIVAEFRAALQMEPEELLPMDAPYFDLGVTSLQLVAARRNLEELLGITISSNVIFNQPTLAQLTGYLTEKVLPESAPAGVRGQRVGQDAPGDELALLGSVLPELNQE